MGESPKPTLSILGAFRDLAAGKLDAVVVRAAGRRLDSRQQRRLRRRVSKSRGTIETGEGYAFWCKKDNQALLAAMNAALAGVAQADGVSDQKICDKWGVTGN